MTKLTSISPEFIHENLMGPNVALMFAEQCPGVLPADPEARICDLGCGAGLSSLLAAQAVPGTIYAVDSWNTPEQNRERFDAFEFGSRIEAIQADAPELPFEENFFDALFSLDSYNYFGRAEGVIDQVARYVKPGGQIILSFPGLIRPLDDAMMEVFSASWTPEQMEYILPLEWWRDLLSRSGAVRIDEIAEMDCYEQSWADWLTCENEYAVGDRAAMQNGGLELMNMIKVRLTVL